MKHGSKTVVFLVLLLTIVLACSACVASNEDANNGAGASDTAQNGTTNDLNGTTTNISMQNRNPAGYNLYFGNKDYSSLVAERRDFSNSNWTAKNNLIDMATEAINSLIAGPQNNNDYFATMPRTAKVNYIKQEADGVLHVDMSNGYIDGYKDLGTPQSMSIYSIVNTLTDFDGVKRVKFTVDGNPLTINDNVWTDPISRNSKLISAR